MLKRLIKLLLLIMMLMVIFCLSHQSGSASLKLSDGLLYRIMCYFIEEPYLYFDKKTIDFFSLILRKGAHFCEFGLLGILIVLNLEEYLNNARHIIFLAIVLSVLWAISDEIHQYFIPYRAFMISDIMIDSIGSITFIYLYQLFKRCLIKE